jgi:hypothetical protein
MWDHPKPESLSNEVLEEIWDWYTAFVDSGEGDIPQLDDDDFRAMCDAFEDLLGYISYLKDVREMAKELTSKINSVKSDLTEIKNLKRKGAATTVNENMPNHKRYRRH